MLQYFLFILLSTTSVKANTGCTGNYQYERQPVTSFNHCNPVKTILQLECSVLVPSDSTTVTVDWYWSKNISECGRYITEEQGKFTINTNRGSSHLTNVDRITTDLTITSPQTDTGYYWCQVNDPSYNGVFISSNKAPVFDTGTMTTCSGTQSTLQTKCAVGSVPPLICVLTTSSFVLPITSISTDFEQNTTFTSIYVTSSINAGSSTVHTSTKPTKSLKLKDFSQLIYLSSTMSLSYKTPSVTKSNCNNKGLISVLVILSIVMFGLGVVVGGLLTIMWNKWRCRKDVKNPSKEEKRSIPKQADVVTTEDNTAYSLTMFSQDTSVSNPPYSDYVHVYDIPQQ